MTRDHDNKEVSHFHRIFRKIRFITCDEKKDGIYALLLVLADSHGKPYINQTPTSIGFHLHVRSFYLQIYF